MSYTEVLQRAGMQSEHTHLKLAQLGWTGHVTGMPDEQLTQYSMENFRWKSAPSWLDETLHRHPKSPSKQFNILTESCEQIAQDRAKCRCLIRKRADDYEAKRVCEADSNYKECKASRAKGLESHN